MRIFFIKSKIIWSFVASTILIVVAFADVFAAEKKPKAETPTKIKSDIIDINRNSQLVQFINHVSVEKDGSVMLTDKMTVVYHEEKEPKKNFSKDLNSDAENTSQPVLEINAKQDEGGFWSGSESKPTQVKTSKKSEGSSIEKIVAESHVKIFTEDAVATADGGYYDPKEEAFILEKNVIVNDGTSIANGDKFIYYLKTKKGNFIGKNTTSNLSDQTQQNDGKKERVTIIVTDGGINERNKDSKKSDKKSKEISNEQNSSH